VACTLPRVVTELGQDDEVPVACHRAWARLHELVRQAHGQLGSTMDPVPAEVEGAHDVRLYSVLIESDLDPSLPIKWGWSNGRRQNDPKAQENPS
jgi:hypothetical protein